jgi:hypothetical protein
LLLYQELFGFFDMAVGAQQAFDVPFIARLVLVAPKLPVAHSAVNYLLLFFSKKQSANFSCLDGYKKVCPATAKAAA